MIRRSIVLKLWLTIIALVVVVLAILSLYLEQFFDSYVVTMQRRDLMSQAILVSELLEQEPDPVLAYDIGVHVVTELHSHLDIVSPPEENVSMRHFLQGLSAEQRKQLSENQPIILQGIPSFMKSPDPLTDMYALVPVVLSFGQTTAFVVISESRDVAGNPAGTIGGFISVAVLVGLLMTTGLAFVVLKNLSRPLLEMNLAAEQMARGQFDMRVRVVTRDEVGRLGNTFNHVAQELEKSVYALTQEKEEITGILSAMIDAVIATDTEGQITLLNPAAKQRIQHNRALSNDETSSIVLPQELVQLQKDTLEARQATTREFEWNRHTLIAHMTPLYAPNDPSVLRGTLAVVRDVTDERKLDRLRKDFVTNVSHELRTPLAMLQGYAEALLDDFGDDPEQRMEFIQIIHDESLRMRRLVNELLDLAQLESGHFSMQLDDLDIVALARRVVRKFQGLAMERDVSLSVHTDRDEITIQGDNDRLEQVLTNLVDNALRHTFTGGVTMQLATGAEHAIVRVIDTGEGIAQEDLPFVFERFYKADKARTRARGGTGIGLAIARGLIRAHDGEIVVQSERNVGTVFTILLPLRGQVSG
ncbi:MAG: ATP-binding protein [Firmicutes bacterium]|nr:ATP-binding protein [Bacillota bacterium]